MLPSPPTILSVGPVPSRLFVLESDRSSISSGETEF